jgi:predicted RNase H-like HicB family nuclease
MISTPFFKKIAASALLLSTVSAVSAQAPAPTRRPIPASALIPIPDHAPALRFGVATHVNRLSAGWSPDLIPLVRALGVSSFRDEQSWASVEKEKGVYKPGAAIDEAVAKAETLQLEPLMLLVYGNPLYGDGLDAGAMARYANWLIEHHQGKVKFFEIWNEPDNFNFRKTYGGEWNGRGKGDEDGPWVAKFAEFATIVSREIKKKHPEVKLVGYSASAPSTHRLFKYPELWKNLDILAVHPYPYNNAPEVVAFGGDDILQRDGIAVADDNKSYVSQLRRYREGLAKAGRPDMPIWITEVGYTTSQQREKNLWLGFTENAQAIYNTRLGILSAGNGVDRTYFYDFYSDGPDAHNTEHNFGLVRQDYSLKPSYYAIQRLCSLMPGDTKPTTVPTKIDRLWPRSNAAFGTPEAVKAVLDTPQTYAFTRPDGTKVVFFWQPGRIVGDAQEELANVTLTLPKGDITEIGRVVSGQKLTPKITRESESIKITEVPYGADPVYIVLK